MSEIIADYKQHAIGDREVVNWTRPSGKCYFNTPIVYLREATRDEYQVRFPHVELPVSRFFFWEVSVD